MLLVCLGRGAQMKVLQNRPPLRTNKRFGSAEATREAPAPATPASLTMTQQGSVFRGAAGTETLQPVSEFISSDPELVCPKGHFSVGLAKIFISKKALAPSGGLSRRPRASPSQDCVAQLVFQAEVRSCPFPVTALPNRGKFLQAWGHRAWM